MKYVDSNFIEDVVYELCIKANTLFDPDLYNALLQKYKNSLNIDDKTKYTNILNNINLAAESKRPLCQDTGQVVVFVELGNKAVITNKTINNAVNDGVNKAYTNNFYRKSVVKNAIFDRTNTKNNTPVLIYTDIVEGDKINIHLMVKGAGSENCSAVKMFTPGVSREEIFSFIKDSIIRSGEKSCPPLVLGIGIGGTMDYAALLSKKAFFHILEADEKAFVADLLKYLGDTASNILDIRLMTSSTHIASLPVALTFNCHSMRHASCVINGDSVVYKPKKENNFLRIENDFSAKEILCSDIAALSSLKSGDNFLLTGEIYTARDAAHKKFKEYYDLNKKLPVDFKGKIVFYAGPCPAAAGEIIGPIGPTTSARMDEYCELMYSNGLFASIGKGERSNEAKNIIEKYKGRYFIAQGGIACLLSKCVKHAEIVAFDELGTEAVRKLYVERLPLKVVI